MANADYLLFKTDFTKRMVETFAAGVKIYGRDRIEDDDIQNAKAESNSITNQELICKGWFLPPNKINTKGAEKL